MTGAMALADTLLLAHEADHEVEAETATTTESIVTDVVPARGPAVLAVEVGAEGDTTITLLGGHLAGLETAAGAGGIRGVAVEVGAGSNSPGAGRGRRLPPKERTLGEPNQVVVLQGLPLEADETVIQQHLESLDACVESTRVIRERRTGKSRGYAFVRFMSIEHARVWTEKHFPSITMAGLPVRIDFSNSAPQDEDDWCGVVNFKRREQCFQCRQAREAVEVQQPLTDETFVNDGSRDVGEVQNHILLVRGLDTLTGEQALYDTVAAMLPLRSARIAANYFLTLIFNPLQPRPLIINDRTLEISYAHISSFVSSYSYSPWMTASYQDATGKTVYLTYWDEQAYCAMYPVADAAVAATTAAVGEVELPPGVESGTKVQKVVASVAAVTVAAAPVIEKPPEKNLDDELAAFYEDVAEDMAVEGEANTAAQKESPTTLDAKQSAMPSSSSGIISAKALGEDPNPRLASSVSQTAESVSFTHNTDGAATKAAIATTFVAVAAAPVRNESRSMTGVVSRVEGDGGEKGGAEAEKKKDKKVSATIAGKKMRAQMAKWQEKKAELKAAREFFEAEDEGVDEDEEAAPVQLDLSDEALLARLPPDAEINEKHSDMSLLACLLCQRGFKQVKDLQKHHAKSDLHKTNLAEYKQKQVVELRERLAAEAAQQQTQYRNRAAERRMMYGQPEKIKDGRGGGWARKGGRGGGGGGGYQPPAFQQSVNQSLGSDNIGNRMLQKMGWKEGTGLGAAGNGIVAPVVAESYARGAGLGSVGAQGGGAYEAGSYKEHLQRMTRARWEEESG
ncbi:hypothetical protein HDV00_006742 [Rhizophlyctis rosea]|nr:hypothetical protein HDV00_006742 [Rhizophlyctis rosea]